MKRVLIKDAIASTLRDVTSPCCHPIYTHTRNKPITPGIWISLPIPNYISFSKDVFFFLPFFPLHSNILLNKRQNLCHYYLKRDHGPFDIVGHFGLSNYMPYIRSVRRLCYFYVAFHLFYMLLYICVAFIIPFHTANRRWCHCHRQQHCNQKQANGPMNGRTADGRSVGRSVGWLYNSYFQWPYLRFMRFHTTKLCQQCTHIRPTNILYPSECKP